MATNEPRSVDNILLQYADRIRALKFERDTTNYSDLIDKAVESLKPGPYVFSKGAMEVHFTHSYSLTVKITNRFTDCFIRLKKTIAGKILTVAPKWRQNSQQGKLRLMESNTTSITTLGQSGRISL